MEGGAAAATIEVLVQNLINVAGDEISLIPHLDIDAQKLKASLASIQSYLNDADNKLITQDAVKAWLYELEAMAFDADNVLDELNYHLLCNKVEKLKPLKHQVLSFFSSFNHLARPPIMAHQIKEINTNLESINKKAFELGLECIVVRAPAAPAAALQTNSFTLDPIFIGRDDDVSEVVDMLTETRKERVFSIVAIVGMGGMGKTTLTRKVFNHQRIKAQFGSLIWVHVSQAFDPIILLRKILKELGWSQSDEADRQAIQKKLQEALKAKTCFVVLDDVWNQDLQKWEDFINSLLGVTSTKGNGIIMTTRSTEVASTVNPLHIHLLNGLSDEECWSIIKARTFENGDVASGYEIIGRKITKRCQGLPLAANVVGGVLRSKSEAEWLSVQQNWLSNVERDNNISKILKLSFDNLPSPSLKKCFAYCSIFPKGNIIKKQQLIELWMAEGFLQPDQKNDMESVGNKFVNVLLHNSLLLIAKRDYFGDVESFVMHDLVHDLACSLLGSCKVDFNHADGFSRVRYIYHERDRDEARPIPKEVTKYIRTLIFHGEISGTIFSDFKSLHVLTLTSHEIKELPNSIRQLIHLRSFNISLTHIRFLPEWIGELHHLQTLRAETRYLKKLPSTFKYLINLRHLYIHYDAELPAEIGRLTCLQTLPPHFTVGDKKGYKIEELGSLKNLKGVLHIRNLEKVHDKEEAEKANIFHKPNLSSLGFEWGYSEGERNDESVLEGLQPHPNLSNLGIYKFQGKRFPLWFMKMEVRGAPQSSWIGLNKLTTITLSGCKECEEIPALGHLPNLKSLYMYHLGNVKSINSSFYNIGACKETTINVFPALEKLIMESMPKLREWAEVETRPNCEVKLFPQLQYLEISHCKELMSAPTHFHSCLKQLKIYRMDSHMPLANILESNLTPLTALSIEVVDGLECLPDWLFYNSYNLSELKISKCPKLRELPNGLHTLNSLEKLIIENCPNLTSIGNPSGQGGLTSLHSLEILECGELMDLSCEMPSLEKLSLVNLRSLRNLPMLLNCLKNASQLRELRIVESCSARIQITSDRVKTLEMDVSMESSREASFAIKEIVDGMLQGCCNSLTLLKLRGMEVGGCLPESIHHLTALSQLVLEKFEEEELPEWLGNLSSLEWLSISNCNNLRHLSFMDAMHRLTKLRYLYVKDCPGLRIISQCLKISHLKLIVDDRLIQPSEIQEN